MENYGRKIIDYIFGKRSNSSAVSYEREQKIQANSDRSDIRVFETGISPQRHGNIRQSSRAAEEEECYRLISIAKENNLYIDKADWDKFGNRRMMPTGESIVFFEQGGKCLHKDEISIFQGSFKTNSSGGYYLRASDTQHVISSYQIQVHRNFRRYQRNQNRLAAKEHIIYV